MIKAILEAIGSFFEVYGLTILVACVTCICIGCLVELFKQSLLETDADKRADLFHQIAKIESDDLYWIPLYGNAGIAGVSSRVHNFVCDFRGITFQIENWTVD